MPGALITPEEVGPADAARVLTFLNAVASAQDLADTIGLSEGASVGRRVAAAILARRAEGPLLSLGAVLAVTGVTLPRFTEIVTALSGARPAPPGGTLRLTPTSEMPWLGQGVGIVGQLIDASGRGVPNAAVTCIASAGLLAAQAGAERQEGVAVSLVTGPGGLIQFRLGPPIGPPLDTASAAALQAELARLPPEAATPAAAREALAGLAARYRAEGAGLLRAAVDRLARSLPAEADRPEAPWPVMPVTVIALASGAGGRAEQVTVLTLRVRNWLGGWLRFLRATVAGDPRLDAALKNLDRAAHAGADLSEALIRTTQAFAGLERGEIGARLRDQIAAAPVNAYVERVAPSLGDVSVVNAVRAAGASRAAISAGGFAVFEAIRATQDVQDTIEPKRLGRGTIDPRLDAFDRRLGTLEAEAVDRGSLDRLRDEILAFTGERFDRVQGRVETLEARPAPDLEGFEARLTRSLEARFAERLSETESRLGGMVADTRRELSGEIAQTRRDLVTRIDTKADATDVRGLERSVTDLRSTNATLANRLNLIRPDR